MKIFRNILLIVSVIMGLGLSAQNAFVRFPNSTDRLIVTDDSYKGFSLSYSFDALYTDIISNDKGDFNDLILSGAYYDGGLGEPKLPVIKKMIEVPFGANVEVEVISFNEEFITLADFGIRNPIVPMQNSVRKDEDLENLNFVFNQDAYNRDAFIGRKKLADVEIVGAMRDIRLACMSIAPVSYNPAKGVIRVINDIELRIQFVNADNEKDNAMKAYASRYFSPMRSNLLNHGVGASRQVASSTQPERYLIVSHNAFTQTLQPFIEWKTKQGFDVDVHYLSEIGNTADTIKYFIHQQYLQASQSNPAPSFLLIVGDTPQVPASRVGTMSHRQTDLYYACVDDDIYPDMLYGRMSAQNSQQLKSQIDKILYYEKYEFAHPEYLDDATLIAGADATWNPLVAQPTINYATVNYFNADHGFNNVYAYLTSPYTGSYSPSRIAVGMINYTAHCNETVWGTPELTKNAVNHFENEGMYPIAFANCCLSGDFGHDECIGETWMRAADKGAAAYIGSSPNSYWYEDFYWSVGAHHFAGGFYPSATNSGTGAYDAMFSDQYNTTGSLLFCGDMAVSEANSSNYPTSVPPLYYWEGYNLLGDPSMLPYFTQAQPNNVSHAMVMPIGESTFEVSAEAGSVVSISKDGVIAGVGVVDASGAINLDIHPIYSVGTVDVVVTKPNFIPYIDSIPAAVLNGPYLLVNNVVINDADGNGNGKADYSETFSLNMNVMNVGIEPTAGPTTLSVSGYDPYIVQMGTENIPQGLAPNADYQLNNSFMFIVADSVPDGHEAHFMAVATQDTNVWFSEFKIKLQAPVLETTSLPIVVDDNEVVDVDETTNLKFTLKNTGSSAVRNVQVELVSADNMLVINDWTHSFEVINPDEEVYVLASVTSAADCPIGYPETISLTASSLPYSVSKNFEIVIGTPAIYKMSTDTIYADYGIFVDSGGENANYTSMQNFTKTFVPVDMNAYLQFDFQLFETETNYDILSVYDGMSVNDPLLASMSGNIPQMFTATNDRGALTFHFESDDNIVKAGWYAPFRIVPRDLSVNETLLDDVVVYPNPAENTVNVCVGQSVDECSYILFNAQGQQVSSRVLGFEGSFQIDMSPLSNGIYFLRLNIGNQFTTKKIIIHR